jgi:N-acetylgalactosamine-6-sulfatase
VGNVGRYDDAVWLEKRGELGLPVSENTLAMRLKAAGYDTAIFGKWHLGYGDKFSPNRHGFDEAIALLGGNADYFTYREDEGPMTLTRNGKPYETTGYLTDVIGREAAEWLGNRKASKPFFLYVPFTAPHTPIQDPAEFDPKTGTAPRRQGHRPTFARMVERMDKVIGDLIGKLGPNTIVIFTSDNGAERNGRNAPFRGNKSFTWEGGIRVPCVISWPGVVPAGSITEQPAITMDLTATLLAAGGADKARTDGIDLRPVLDGSKPVTPRTLFWRYRRAENTRKAVRKGNMKLVVDNGAESLHDLAADPGEKNNLLETKPAVATELRALLGAWEKEVRAGRLERIK